MRLDHLPLSKTVKRIQANLAKLGYDIGSNDGIMGLKTINAIKSYQKSQGIKPTGALEKNVLDRLSESVSRIEQRINGPEVLDLSSRG